jgi:hypothetical protein
LKHMIIFLSVRLVCMGQQATREQWQPQENKRRRIDGDGQMERGKYSKAETREFSEGARNAKEKERNTAWLKDAFRGDPSYGGEELGCARF